MNADAPPLPLGREYGATDAILRCFAESCMACLRNATVFFTLADVEPLRLHRPANRARGEAAHIQPLYV